MCANSCTGQREPTFFIIGAQKAGTTSLHYYLSMHPDIYMPRQKELTFFCDDVLYQSIKYGGYLKKYFSNVPNAVAVGEATPAYLFNADKVAPRVARDVRNSENLKFIVILRDPVQRAVSHYLHAKRVTRETRSFEDAIFLPGINREVDVNSQYIRNSLYFHDCKVWFSYFDKENFFFIRTEELSCMEKFQQLLNFLGVRPLNCTKLGERKNPRARARSEKLMKLLVRDSLIKRIGKTIIPPNVRQELRLALVRWNEITVTETFSIKDDIASKLRQYFRSDMEKMESLISRDLSDWK